MNDPKRNGSQRRENHDAKEDGGVEEEHQKSSGSISLEAQNRFWTKVNKNGPLPDQSKEFYTGLGRCWLWTASVSGDGYGATHIRRKFISAHRFAFWVHTEIDPRGSQVLHKCDNPLCVNPDHLFLGDHSANMADAKLKKRNAHGQTHGSYLHPECVGRGERHKSVTKPWSVPRGDRHHTRLNPGRMPKGEGHYHSKLTNRDVKIIRDKYSEGGYCLKDLSLLFSVSISLIGQIVRRKVWKHIE